MLAKVIAHAPTRAEAAGRLALALERLHLGGVTTNRDFLVAVLRRPAFLAGDTTTDFIERVAPPRALELTGEELERAAQLAALWVQGRNRADAVVLAAIPSGWRNARLPDQRVVLEFRGSDDRRLLSPRCGTAASAVGDGTHARVHAWSRDAIDAEIDGRRIRARITQHGERILVRHPARRRRPRRRAALRDARASVSGGRIRRAHARHGARRARRGGRPVAAGQTLVVLEAMKMEHPMSATEPTAWCAEVRVAVGDQVESGAVLLVVEADGAGEA